ncbi:MAG: gliding motility-associated C-terminal domain-containing protein, partial [Bacteroidota bacterium]
TTLKYTVTDASNNSDSCSFNITVLAEPNPGWELINTRICEIDNPIDLNTLVTGDSGGTWSGTGVISSTFNPSIACNGFHTITYLVDNGICNEDSSIIIEVLNQPVANAGNDTSVCGLNCQLNAVISVETGYWTSTNNITYSPDSIFNNPIITVAEYGTYTLTWLTNIDSVCFDDDQVEVTFYRPPENIDAGSDQNLDYTFETYMQANYPIEGYGEWSVISGNAEIQNINNPETYIYELGSGTTIFQWTIINGMCVDSDDVSVYIADLKIPTGFSPNNDGFNDFFEIPGIENYQSKVSVFDRWGRLIFEMEQYDNTWDGKGQNDKPLPDDTYFYIIEIADKTYNGYVMINR